MLNKLRIIGDIHSGRYAYKKIVRGAPGYSVQLGDLCHEGYAWLSDIDGAKHFFVGGNHENYGELRSSPPPNYLGNFGYKKLGKFDFFFVRGALSINKADKKLAKIWWEEEELNEQEQYECLESYLEHQPEFIISHTCPQQIVPHVSHTSAAKIFKTYGIDPTNNSTERLLQQMFERHQPRLWIFGHYHRDWTRQFSGCKFICLDKFSYLDI